MYLSLVLLYKIADQVLIINKLKNKQNYWRNKEIVYLNLLALKDWIKRSLILKNTIKQYRLYRKIKFQVLCLAVPKKRD